MEASLIEIMDNIKEIRAFIKSTDTLYRWLVPG